MHIPRVETDFVLDDFGCLIASLKRPLEVGGTLLENEDAFRNICMCPGPWMSPMDCAKSEGADRFPFC